MKKLKYRKTKTYHLMMTGHQIRELRGMLIDSVMYNDEHNYHHHSARAEAFLKWFDTGQFLIEPMIVKPQKNQYYRLMEDDDRFEVLKHFP